MLKKAPCRALFFDSIFDERGIGQYGLFLGVLILKEI